MEGRRSPLVRALARALLATLVLAVAPVPLSAQQLELDGAAALGVSLRRLGTTKRVLMIGAHPDDENTALLAELALGDGADVAYLSLTRGEGGQNLVGADLQEALGLLRTEELLAARRLDGARQFFTRAYDFGYSKSADEAFRQWPHDELLADVVEVVRRYRPDILVATFSGTPADGHGHHQASGILAREAFSAAADPARFPDQIARGLAPHQPTSIWQSLYRPSDDAAVQVSTGDLDPLLGRSQYQIAMASRSRHRSQDMGSAEPLGTQVTSVSLVAGVRDARSLFAGVDTTLALRARALGATTIAADLAAYERDIADARARFNPLRPTDIVEPLARAATTLSRVEAAAVNLQNGAAFLVFVTAERLQVQDALRRAAGVVVEATSDAMFLTPGQTFTLTLRLLNGGTAPIGIAALVPSLPAGWTAQAQESAPPTLAPGRLATRRFRITVARDAEFSNPYFLRAPRAGEMYGWPDDPAVRALPFEPPPVHGLARIEVGGASLAHSSEAMYVEVDKSLGEVRQPLLVVPIVNVAVEPRTRVLPLAAASHAFPLTVTVASAAESPIRGQATLVLPQGWRADPAAAPLTLTPAGEPASAPIRVLPPATLTSGTHTVVSRFTGDGVAAALGYRVIDYPHTRPRLLFEPARTDVAVIDVAIAPDLRVGYVAGAGDDGALALEQLGARVEFLDAAALARADLSVYHAIVLGIRAYEVRFDLIAHNTRLLDYARGGGTVIVQYNKYEYVDGDFAPYPLTMSRPHDRVADETAPVRILAPDHPLLTWPNRIDQDDFAGWVQERGLYYAATWDDRYTPLLEMNDEGEEPLRGSLLVAQVGSGHYVYTALSFFRQWPVAVPGAYRLFANLVSRGQR
jgi:LmbE family N-acetylglucosaminyl deacetylase